MDTKSLPRLSELTQTQYTQQMSLEYAKWLGCLAETNQPDRASDLYLTRYPTSLGATFVRKAVTAPGTTTDATWAGPLAGVQAFEDAFLAIARSASLLGRIPGLRKIPFNVKVPSENVGATYQWVAENAPKPASSLAFTTGVTLTATKHSAIVLLSRELVQLAVKGMEGALRDTLVAGLTAFTDKSFLDPALAAVAGKNPSSVTNPTTPIASTSNYTTDVASLLAAFFAGRPSVQEPVLIANAAHAAQLRSMNSGGGTGLPVIVSEAALGNTIAMDPNAVFVADQGVEVSTSKEAMVQMNDAPDNPGTAATVFTSLWQLNLVGFRVERFVNWQAATGAVKYLAG